MRSTVALALAALFHDSGLARAHASAYPLRRARVSAGTGRSASGRGFGVRSEPFAEAPAEVGLADTRERLRDQERAKERPLLG